MRNMVLVMAKSRVAQEETISIACPNSMFSDDSALVVFDERGR